MSYSFFLDKAIVIEQDTKIVAIPSNNYESSFQYDYLININVRNGTTGFTSVNQIFSEANYSYCNTSNTVTSTLTISNDNVFSIFNKVTTRINDGSRTRLTFAAHEFPPREDKVAIKFKEIMAVKLFGSAVGITALTTTSSSEFDTSIPTKLKEGLFGVFDTSQDNLFFQQYVASGRFEQDLVNYNYSNTDVQDLQYNIPYNLQGIEIAIPIFFTGTVKDNTNTTTVTNTLYPTLAYPSAAFLGSSGVNIINPTTGAYNISLLLKLHD